MEKRGWWASLFSPTGKASPQPDRATTDALFPVRVASCEALTPDVRAFELIALPGKTLPRFSAGAHIDIQICPGLRRQYSLCNAPWETHRYRIAVLRAPQSRGGSTFMHDRVAPGDTLQISRPRNHFGMAPDQRRARLIAGGIGITPILAMAEMLHQHQTPFTLTYAARSRTEMAFLNELHSRPYIDRCHLHFDKEAGGPLDIAGQLAKPEAGEHLYVCGPTGLIGATVRRAAAMKWGSAQVHREHFSNTVTKEGDRAFMLVLGRSGRRIAVPADRSALCVLRDAGVDIPTSCEEGTCGTCVTRVLGGEPDHRDVCLTAAERRTHFTPCCSRAVSEALVLDL